LTKQALQVEEEGVGVVEGEEVEEVEEVVESLEKLPDQRLLIQ
jgi:hypothetical protein